MDLNDGVYELEIDDYDESDEEDDGKLRCAECRRVVNSFNDLYPYDDNELCVDCYDAVNVNDEKANIEMERDLGEGEW